MPGSRRRPKGSYFRGTLNWFYSEAGVVGGDDGVNNYPAGAPFHYNIFSLYNDDAAGRKLHVYGFAGYSDGIGRVVWGLSAAPAGSLLRRATALDFGGVAPPGALYLNATTTGNPYEPGLIDVRGIVPDYFGSGAFISDGPLWVIPPGMSLVMYDQDGSTASGVNFWFIPMAN